MVRIAVSVGHPGHAEAGLQEVLWWSLAQTVAQHFAVVQSSRSLFWDWVVCRAVWFLWLLMVRVFLEHMAADPLKFAMKSRGLAIWCSGRRRCLAFGTWMLQFG